MRLPRACRLIEGSDFRAVRESGKSKAGRYLVLGVLEDPLAEGFRFGFVTSRKVGNAVVRNRVRRRLRAVVREIGEELSSSLGGRIVTIARYNASQASYQDLASDWRQLARRHGMLGSDRLREEQQ